MGVDQVGLDKMGVDEMGVDQVGSYRLTGAQLILTFDLLKPICKAY